MTFANKPGNRADDRRVCTRLRALRKAAGYSQTALAYLVGSAQSDLSAAENGRRRPSRRLLLRLCAVLSYTGAPEDLLDQQPTSQEGR
jgi:transcriptional regulator with XRE-family HTH domain